MSKKFQEYKALNLSEVSKTVLEEWKQKQTFEQSLETRKGNTPFVFYEGPPSANGKPGIHHVMSRTIKDLICRYKTQQGFLVERKAGWDTHGLPVELAVEKALGITKEDIGKSISVAEYNARCREAVMEFTDLWENITDKMGYWVDMEKPYITYDNRYIETLWWMLKQLHEKDLLYKGYTIQPYSPAAGTGLSSHELNLPNCYRDVSDNTVIAQFKLVQNVQSKFIFDKGGSSALPHFFLAWTTTPWTLPSNTALAVGGNITYLKVQTFNPYTHEEGVVILAKELYRKYFTEKNEELLLEDYKPGDKQIPYKVLGEFKGQEFELLSYEQLIPWQQPEDGDGFKVLVGDFVSTEDGTGIVHIAPSFGADDFRVAKKYGIGSLTLVDKQGKFVDGCANFSGRYVKNEYDITIAEPEKTDTVDVDIIVMLKKGNKAFKTEKYVHSYPHCWRTDKPILYYPLDSWFIKTTAKKERMMELNKTINWQPESTGTGRFGKWLENLVDWNLSRSRYWGTPLPIWATEDHSERKCIGSVAELKAEIQKAVDAGFMPNNPLAGFVENDFSDANYDQFNLHRPFVDEIVLVSSTGEAMNREPDLIDVWFDSGAMPYAQLHYPFENKDVFAQKFPADFIAEGVDQTRGWFFTLHALSTLLFDSVAFKNIISNGLVLDEKGVKMSKRLGNVIDPFEAIDQYGADAVRWYMITNSPPWENLKFAMSGIEEYIRKFFGTLYNTYSFFALYANVDGFTFAEKELPMEQRPEIDRWVLSLLNTLVIDVTQHYENYDPTKAGRAVQNFVTEDLSNWYVRLNRKRFWGTKYSDDKVSAYQTLFTCLKTVAHLMAPIAPFYADRLFNDLNAVSGHDTATSVHLSKFPVANTSIRDTGLEERMLLAQRISSMVLGLRRKVSINVRKPLSKILIPILDKDFGLKVDAVKDIILTEVNIKDIEYLTDTEGVIKKRIKPNFKTLGPRYGKIMKQISAVIGKMDQKAIAEFERNNGANMVVDGELVELQPIDVEISSEDIPGWTVASEGLLTIALDITITEELRQEGIARELINRIQRQRRESGLDVTDKIVLKLQKHEQINDAVLNFNEYISSQTLAASIELVDSLSADAIAIEIDDIQTAMQLVKV